MAAMAREGCSARRARTSSLLFPNYLEEWALASHLKLETFRPGRRPRKNRTGLRAPPLFPGPILTLPRRLARSIPFCTALLLFSRDPALLTPEPSGLSVTGSSRPSTRPLRRCPVLRSSWSTFPRLLQPSSWGY